MRRERLGGGGETFTPRPAGDHEYDALPGGNALAVAGDFALIGTEAEVRRGLAALDGDGLAGEDRYRAAIDPLPDGRLASYYLDRRDPSRTRRATQRPSRTCRRST